MKIFSISLLIFLGLTVCIMNSQAADNSQIKKPDVAGQFYPANPKEITSLITKFFNDANIEPLSESVDVLVVPHAGHVYSGPVAAYGFKAISQQPITTIILLGPTHYYQFEGVSIWPVGGFETPLGTLKVDEDMAQKIMNAHDYIRFGPQVFERDHVLEVEMPFIQHTFKDVKIVPMIMSRDVSREFVDAFSDILVNVVEDRDDVLLMVSSDLSHFHDDRTARRIDKRGIDAVLAGDVEKLWTEHVQKKMEIDGYKEVVTGLLFAQKRGANDIKMLKYAHSGDVSGDNDRVVGYTSITMAKGEAAPKKTVAVEVQSESTLNIEQKRRLIEIAKNTIFNYVEKGKTYEFKEDDPRLKTEEGTFVTIKKDGRLRGCIGNILGSGPLCYLVRDMAISSATQDPRFSPLTKEELKDITVEVSVLSKPKVIKSADEIVMGKHGVIIQKGNRSGVFLPKVATDTGWSKEEFLSQLCSQKAGLPPNCWKDPGTRIEIFSADEFSENDVN